VVEDIERIIMRLNQEAGLTVLLVERTSPSSAASP
jgi:ABC-type branched-subunit amino acid transport system ATPase component